MLPHSLSGSLVLVACLCLCRVVAVPIQADAESGSSRTGGDFATGGSLAEKGVVGGCWVRGERVEAEELVQLRVAVKQSQSGLEALEAAVMASSDPSSAQYGRQLTLQQVQELVTPPTHALQTVRQWLREAGVSSAQMRESSNGDFISGLVPSATISSLLGGMTLYHFECGGAVSTTIIRTREVPRIPAHVADVVDFVSPGYRFPAVRRIEDVPTRIKLQPAPPPGEDSVTPSMLRKLYNISANGGKSDVSQGVASFLHEYFSPEDLLAFQQQFSPASTGRTPKVVGANVPSSPTLEASLDIEYLMGVAPSVSTEFWYTAGTQPHNRGAEPFVEFLAALSSTPDMSVPKVFSISYADDENQVDLAYARRVSVELQKAGARGISLLVASGDFGVGGNTDQICHGKPFIPTFPASSPYITAVGGTWQQKPEVAFEISSGGFSNYFARPQYQEKAVRAFFKTAHGTLPPKHRYNATGRGIPDIAAQSANFPIKVKGKDDAGYGTSAAAPVVAAIVSLLNDERLAVGKSTVGFLNPLIYSILDHGLGLFHDITSGHNPGCGSPGFSAQQGWDPVTGAGTPEFGKLLEYVLSLP